MISAVENSHSYLSEYAWHCGEQSDHPVTQREVADELRRRYASDWPSICALSHDDAGAVDQLAQALRTV